MNISYQRMAQLRTMGYSYQKIADCLAEETGLSVHKGSICRSLKNKKDYKLFPKNRFFPIWESFDDSLLPYRIAEHLAKKFGRGEDLREETVRDFVLDFLYRQNLSNKLKSPFISDGQAWKYLNFAAYGAVTGHFLRLKEEKWKKDQV